VIVVKIKIDNRQLNLEQFGFYSGTKSRSLIDKASRAYLRYPKPPIGISYRECGEGKGAYFDHYTLQLTTSAQTRVLISKNMRASKLKEYVRQTTHALPSNPVEVATDDQGFGLLYLPGVSRGMYDSQEFAERGRFQSDLVEKALLEGRPMLAVCGGCWQLWEDFGGKIQRVKDHNYRGGMPRVKDSTGKIGYNKQVHRIQLSAESCILPGAMLGIEKTASPAVNSVHWLACSEKSVSPLLDVAARSLADPELSPNMTCDGVTRALVPEECIEAFESKFGAPILGLQWHPEAYTSNSSEEHEPQRQVAILNYMIEAGKAFELKRKLVKELQGVFQASTSRTPWQRHRLRRLYVGNKRLLQTECRGTRRKSDTMVWHLLEKKRVDALFSA
jgi:gamma-glutamyl-gamma-aminobutyrate hydrolase PuuD